MPNQSIDLNFSEIEDFFTPHADVDPIDAQDVVGKLLTHSINVTSAAWLLFKDIDGNWVNTGSDDITANLLWDILNKLKLIEKTLPIAYNNNNGEA